MPDAHFYDDLREYIVAATRANRTSSLSSSTGWSWTLHEEESRADVIRVDLHVPVQNYSVKHDNMIEGGPAATHSSKLTQEGGGKGGIFRSGHAGQPKTHNGNHIKVAETATTRIELRHLVFMAPLTFAARKVFPLGSEEMIAGAILATHHFNNGITDVIPQMPRNCPIKFTLEAFDTSLSAKTASTYLVRDLLPRLRQGIDPSERGSFVQHPPAPTALVASLSSRITKPLAAVSGRSNLVQMTYSSTDDSLDYKDQYPLSTRSGASNTNVAIAALDYLRNIVGTTHFVLLNFIPDFERSVLKVASWYKDPPLVVAPFEIRRAATGFGLSEESQIEALNFLEASTYRHVMLYGTFSYFENLMLMARDRGLVGPHMFWFGILDPGPSGAVLKPDVFDAVHGMSVMSLKVVDAWMGKDRGIDSFMASYDEFRSSPQNLAFLKRKAPQHLWDHPDRRMYNMSSFQLGNPNSYTLRIYDSVVAFGIASCHAAGYSTPSSHLSHKDIDNDKTTMIDDNNNNRHDRHRNSIGGHYFDGNQLFRSLVYNTSFDGSFGRIVFDPKTGTRDIRTVPLIISNVLVTTDSISGNLTLTARPSYGFNPQLDNIGDDKSESIWMPLENSPPFLYRDGSTIPPDSLPPVTLHHIPLAARSIGFGMSLLCILTSVVCAIWTVWMSRPAKIKTTTATTSTLVTTLSSNRNNDNKEDQDNTVTAARSIGNRVVRASQPVFLFLICVGSSLMGMAGIVENLHYTMPQWWLDVSCMLSVWLFGLGYTIAFAALYSKLRRVNRLHYSQQAGSKRARAPSSIWDVDVMLPCVALVAMQLIVLVSWTVFAPLTYVHKTTDAVDIYGRPTEEYGTCQSSGGSDDDDRNPLYFWIPFASVIAFSTAGTLLQAYQARNVDSDYSESSHIFVAKVLILEAYLVGLPVRLMGPPTSDFVNAVTMPLTALTLLVAIFAPKIANARKEARPSAEAGNENDNETPLLQAAYMSTEDSAVHGHVEYNHHVANEASPYRSSATTRTTPLQQQQQPPSSLPRHWQRDIEGVKLTEERLLSIIAMTGEADSSCSMLVLTGEAKDQQRKRRRGAR